MKTKTPEQEIKSMCADIKREISVWEHLNEYGGQDPFWADGLNMNLTRNHIISYKHQIKEICEENNFDLPEEYFLGTPPKVDDGYMASLSQKDRVNRLKQQREKITRKSAEYDPAQMSMF